MQVDQALNYQPKIFQDKILDQFYNIQLDISKTGIMEKGYKQVNMMLAP